MNKLRTGIEGLDNITDGGIPMYSLNIISGAPGSGKTIFIQNIIFNSAKRGLKTLYLTTISESQFKMVRHLQEFDFFSDDSFGNNFVYEDLGVTLRKDGAQNVLNYLNNMIRQHKPDLLVIDSFKAIRDIFFGEKTFRAFIFELATALSIWEITVFLVGEYGEKDMTLLSEFAIADGIFHLYGQEERRFQKRFLRILKLRGTDFEQGEHLFQITSEGIKIFPRMKPEGKELAYKVATPNKKEFGIAELDEMLDGGLKEGTVTLISGGTGSGKTLFGLKFLLEGAKKGEKGLFISFEEPVDQLIENADELGWDLNKYITNGLLDIRFYSPIELDIDKHGFDILNVIKDEKINRLVIDSISSFETSVADLEKYKDYLWALTQNIKRQRTTALFTVLNESLFSPVVITKAQISLISDNIIVLRYVEDTSKVKKVLGVLKTRGANHDKDLREYEITSNGINILEKLDKADILK